MNRYVILFIATLALTASASCLPGPASGDIYRYEDPDGTLHFTDAPTDKRFKVFMRDIKKDRKLRTAFKLPGFARNPAEFEPIISSYSREYGVDARSSRRGSMRNPVTTRTPYPPRGRRG